MLSFYFFIAFSRLFFLFYILQGQCAGNCKCKRHVMGDKCDRCKPGFFALLDANPDGCTECFCYGVTNICNSADLGVEILEDESEWHVTDISGRIRVSPYWSSATSGLAIAQVQYSKRLLHFITFASRRIILK